MNMPAQSAEKAHERPKRDDFAFHFELRVRWAELDPQGIVFNPNYLVYADQAVTEYMRAIGYPYPTGLAALGVDMFAVQVTANFRDAAVFDDWLTLAARVTRIGQTSIAFAVGVFRQQALLTDIALTYVCANRATRKPTPVPPAFIERIMSFETQPPERRSP